MTRTTNTAPRTNSLSMAHSSRSRKSAGTDSRAVDVKQRKGQNWTVKLFNPKNDLDVDFSLKEDSEHSGVRVDDSVEFEDVLYPSSGRQPRKTSNAHARPEVQLLDLLVPPRKSQKGKDGDFEVVPHIRPVIVLDDTMTPDIDTDEPWEHVSLAEQQSAHPLSYARVTSLN